jgi:hypothetical protein
VNISGFLSDLWRFVLRRPALPTLVDSATQVNREIYSRRIMQRVGISIDRYSVLNIHQIGIRAPVAFVFEELRRWSANSSWWPNHIAAFERVDGRLEHVRIFFLGRKKLPLGLDTKLFGLNVVPLFELHAQKIHDRPDPLDCDNARYLLYDCRGGYPIGILAGFVRSPIATQGERDQAQFFFVVGFNFYGREDWSNNHFVNAIWERIHNRVTANVLNRFKRKCETRFGDFIAGKRSPPP